MEMMQLLSSVVLNHFGQTYDVSLSWIAAIIEWLVAGIGIVGVGVIVFSLILKCIVLPFDVMQRISMRKQNNKMQENQERMQKLQKQYANDKEKYNQKVMEMYKENGISMFSSCLPLILSMIVFFAAIGGFNAYSQYANIQNYNSYVQAYNEKIESYAPEATAETTTFVWNETTAKGELTVKAEDKAVYYVIEIEENLTNDQGRWVQYVNSVLGYNVKNSAGKTIKAKYYADVEKTFATYDQLTATGNAEEDQTAVLEYYSEQARNAVVAEYEANSYNRVGFLWVKNIWNVDAVYEHPLTEYEKMMTPVKNLFSPESTFDVNGENVSFEEMKNFDASPYKDNSYNEITKNMEDARNKPNGYFIWIALSIGTILLQQFITMRSQKAQNQYSSVDGQQAQTQKMTMVIMTVMFGIFSFMYSTAFSIYMVTSSLFSLLSTMVINKLVDNSMNKAEEAAMKAKYNRTLPGQKPAEDKNTKKK